MKTILQCHKMAWGWSLIIRIIEKGPKKILNWKIIITEMKNWLEGFNSIFEQGEEKKSAKEDINWHYLVWGIKIKNIKETWIDLKELWDNIKSNNRIPESEDRKKGQQKKRSVEVVAKNFPNSMKIIILHIQETQ